MENRRVFNRMYENYCGQTHCLLLSSFWRRRDADTDNAERYVLLYDLRGGYGFRVQFVGARESVFI